MVNWFQEHRIIFKVKLYLIMLILAMRLLQGTFVLPLSQKCRTSENMNWLLNFAQLFSMRLHNYLDYFCVCLNRNISDVLWEAISTRQVLSLFQGLGTKNFHSFISSFLYFYGYSFLKRLYLKKSGLKYIGTKANLAIAAAAGACTVVVTQVGNISECSIRVSSNFLYSSFWIMMMMHF